MTLEASIMTALRVIPAIGGPGVGARVQQDYVIWTQTLPAITFFRVSTAFEYAHDGDSNLIHPLFQISCWAATNAAAIALARSVQLVMNAWGGGKALPEGQYPVSDPLTKVHQEVLSYTLWWNVP